MGLKLPRRKPRDETPESAAARREKRRAARSADVRKRAGKAAAGVRRDAGKAGRPLLAGLSEVAAIGREMLAIPAGIALNVAERLGLLILAAWRALRPLLVAAIALARRLLAIAEREVTPARAIAVVAIAAAALLAASQFLDYREVRAGVPAYAGVEEVAPAPQVSGTTRTAGSAHAYVLLAVAVASAALVVLAMLGRWRLARLLFFLGLAAVAIAVFIDAPKGLDEGETAIQFEGAEARLLAAFWVEVTSAAVIAVCGPLLALNLRPARAARRAADERSRSGRRRLTLGRSGVQGARS